MDEARFFHRQAAKCREEAKVAPTNHQARQLQELAQDYEREARRVNLVQIGPS